MTDPGDLLDRLAVLQADNHRLRQLLDEAGVADSLRHALRDTMSLLRTIVRRSSETAADVEDYVAHLEGRIDSLMRMRARTEAFGEADLHLLVAEELMFHLVREGERASIEGPPVRLRPKAAQVLGLALHELVSNAVEHGPLDRKDGRVSVHWRITAGEKDQTLEFGWTEEGGSAPLEGPFRRGFGREVLETMLAYELGAKSELLFAPEGLRCTIRFPFTLRIGRISDRSEGEDDPH
jgi:two-component sensor histidine kinase